MRFGFGGFGGGFGRGYGFTVGDLTGAGRRRGYQGRDDIDRTSIAVMAASNGWQVTDRLPGDEYGNLLDINGGPFAPGLWNAVPPIVLGRAGYWDFVACTVSAMTRAREWRMNAATIMTLPGPVPPVHVYPESWRASVTSVVPEVHLESSVFNDRFSVFAQQPSAVYHVLSPRAMQLLIDLPPFDEVWTRGRLLCIARIDPHNVEALDTHLRVLTTIAGDMPSSAWEPQLPETD